jgi:hypothetical protein
MDYDYSKSVVAVSTVDHKQAALYFDRILPCTYYDEVPDSGKLDWRFLEHTYIKYADEYETEGESEFEEFAGLIKSGLWDHDTLWVANDCTFSAFDALGRMAMPAVPLFYPGDPWQDFRRLFERRQFKESLKFETVEVKLMNMGIVDTSNVTWEQIVEIKQDESAVKKLRNFRLFAYENFNGKSMSYISDRIDQKMDEYELACKKHGLELVSSSVSMLLDSKSLLGLSAIVAASIWAGNWQVASAAAIGETLIETSKLTINVLMKRHEYTAYRTNHELAYLFHLKEKFNGNQKSVEK